MVLELLLTLTLKMLISISSLQALLLLCFDKLEGTYFAQQSMCVCSPLSSLILQMSKFYMFFLSGVSTSLPEEGIQPVPGFYIKFYWNTGLHVILTFAQHRSYAVLAEFTSCNRGRMALQGLK